MELQKGAVLLCFFLVVFFCFFFSFLFIRLPLFICFSSTMDNRDGMDSFDGLPIDIWAAQQLQDHSLTAGHPSLFPPTQTTRGGGGGLPRDFPALHTAFSGCLISGFFF